MIFGVLEYLGLPGAGFATWQEVNLESLSLFCRCHFSSSLFPSLALGKARLMNAPYQAL